MLGAVRQGDISGAGIYQIGRYLAYRRSLSLVSSHMMIPLALAGLPTFPRGRGSHRATRVKSRSVVWVMMAMMVMVKGDGLMEVPRRYFKRGTLEPGNKTGPTTVESTFAGCGDVMRALGAQPLPSSCPNLTSFSGLIGWVNLSHF